MASINKITEARNSVVDANEIYIVAEDKEELAFIKDKLSDLERIEWNESLNYYLTDPDPFNSHFPAYIFINLSSNTMTYALKDNMQPYPDITQSSIFDGVLNKPFNVKDIDYFIKMIKLGKILPNAPTYAPRRIDRTLEEYKNSISEAEEITILIRNVDEYNIFSDAVTSLGYVLSKPVVGLNSPINIFINLKTGVISLAPDIHEYDRHWTDYRSFDGVWERELTIEDLPYLLSILKMGKIIPSYQPRKIIKKLDEEAEFDYLRILPPTPPKLSLSQQKLQYKVGDIVIVRPDAMKYFTDVVDEMQNFLGQKVRIVNIEQAKNKYGEYLEHGVEDPDDLLITVDKEGKYKGSGRWYWYYKCLVNPEFLTPSYKPRKIDRSINEEIVADLSDYLKDCVYFKKYNSFIVISNSDEDKIFLYEVAHLLRDVLDVEVPGGVFTPDWNDLYIAYRVDRDRTYIDSGWGKLENLDDFNLKHDYTYSKYYTTDEVNSVEKIKNILKHGAIAPSYAPRKMDRTLENINEWADSIDFEGDEELNYTDDDAIPFGMSAEDDFIYVGEKSTAHSDFWNDEIEEQFRNDYYIHPTQYAAKFGKICPPVIPIEEIERFYDIEFKDYMQDLFIDEMVQRLDDVKFKGRLWEDSKIISFWDYPKDNDEMKSFISKLEKALGINIWNKDWSIEVYEDDEHKLIPLLEYKVSKDAPNEEWLQHIMSPLLKKKKIPQGWGSTHPKYKSKRLWQMASLTDEGVINESPDWSTTINNNNGQKEVLRWDLPGAYAFGYYKGIMYISPETKGHGSMGPEDERKIKIFSRNDFTFPGRIWTHQKLISFWIYPDKEHFEKILMDLTNFINVHFDDPEWKVEIIEGIGKSKNIPITEYNGSQNVSREDYIKQHVMSPLLKPKKEVPYGYGSKNPSYQPKRAWDMASLTTESAWYTDFKDRKTLLKKGKYECICFDITNDEWRETLKYFKELQIISDLPRIEHDRKFVILTVHTNGLDPYQLYSYSDIDDIRGHMSRTFSLDIDKISPVMTFNEVKTYFNITLAKPAKDMYAPRKIDRTLESVSGIYPYKYVVVKVDSKKDIDTINDELSKISPKFRNDFNFDFEYPNVILLRPNKLTNGEHTCIQAWNDRVDEDGVKYFMSDSRNNADPHIYSMNELDKIKLIIQFGKIMPSYTPRRIDRNI